jgi:hypothetical protein
MASYPSAVYSHRTRENKSGVVYDAGKTRTLFAEDVNKSDDEIAAIETELGTNPKGGYADVKARIVAVEGVADSALQDVVDDTTPQLGGELDTNNKNVNRKSIPSTDNTGEGEIVGDINAGESVAFPNVLYLKSDGKLWKASNAGIATAGLLVVALESKSADQAVKCLEKGYIRDEDWNWTVGGAIYLGTAGGMTQTIPTAVDEVVQVLGYATHADRMKFCPSVDTMTRLAA